MAIMQIRVLYPIQTGNLFLDDAPLRPRRYQAALKLMDGTLSSLTIPLEHATEQKPILAHSKRNDRFLGQVEAYWDRSNTCVGHARMCLRCP